LEEGPPAKKARVDDYKDLFSGDNDDEVDSVSLMDKDKFDNFIAHTAGFTEHVYIPYAANFCLWKQIWCYPL